MNDENILRIIEMSADKSAYESFLHVILESIHSKSITPLRAFSDSNCTKEASELIGAVSYELSNLLTRLADA